MTREFKCKSNIGNNMVDRLDSFPDIHSKSVQVTITVYEGDTGDYETADVSSSEMSFECTYNLVSNALGGNETVNNGEYYKTSGDYDDSLQADENDANLWFAIFDNYEVPVAGAGDDQTVYTGEEANFSGSLSTASEGTAIAK